MSINPKSWAEAFTAELTVGGEHVPLDRVVARHSEAFAELRQLGMTWRGVSTLLVRAGARRADGGLISSDQLRVSYARLSRKDAAPDRKPARGSRRPRSRTAADSSSLASVAPSTPPPSEPIQLRAQQNDPQEVSSTEIEAALSRLNKIAPTE
jgi:hypothetical protein